MGKALNNRSNRALRLFVGANATAAVVLAVALFAIVNYISSRHFTRVDVSRAQIYSLSDKTRAVLDKIDAPLKVTLYMRAGEDYDDIANLLDSYAAEQPLIDLWRIDPDRDLAAARQLLERDDVSGSEVVVFEWNERARVVSGADLFKPDEQMPADPSLPSRRVFLGERHFTSAIQSLLAAERPKAYFLQGHGEGDPFDYDSKNGFSKCAEALEFNNIEIATLLLGEQREIPSDCAVLIVAGPEKRLGEAETALIADYLDDDGRMLLMLESMRDVGLRPLLADWGVVQGDDIVIDRTRTITGRELFITSYGSHPVTAGLQGTSSIMYLPCSLEPRAVNQVGDDGADRPVVTVLATSSAKGWAESDWMRTPMEFDPASEKGGALSVAVAIERGLPDEAGVQVGATRMVVFGDSDFVSNAGLAGGNLDFFQGAVDWMLGREELIAIAPKVIGESRLALSRGQMLTLAAIVMLAMPALALLCALVVWLFRRS